MKTLADRFDHMVLTVNDIEATIKFYERVFGFKREVFPGSDRTPRYALRFGNNKINLQDRATDVVNKAKTPTFGSGDFCLIAAVPVEEVLARLRSENVAIEAGPVARRGAVGPMRSVYFRDPDGNLVEISEYVSVPSRTNNSPDLDSAARKVLFESQLEALRPSRFSSRNSRLESRSRRMDDFIRRQSSSRL